jgi:hypothetical protein
MFQRILALYYALALYVALAIPGAAQVPAGFLRVHQSGLVDSNGAPISNATMCAKVTLNGQNATVQANGQATVSFATRCTAIVNGAWQMNLPDMSLSVPKYACLSLDATDDVSGNHLLTGYSCVQPRSVPPPNLGSAPFWCSNAGCDLGLLPPNYPASEAFVAPVGPQGVQGPQGVPGAITATGVNGDFRVPGVLKPNNLNGILMADQYCTTAGTYDDTCIQNAANAMATLGGGSVFLSPHTYTIANTVTVPSGVHLLGGWRYSGHASYTNGAGCNAQTTGGTTPVLLVKVGAGSTTTPAFIMNAFSGLQGVEMCWPDQVNSSTPTQYGWAIESGSNPDKVVIRDVMMVNPYKGIHHFGGGQWEVDNFYGSPILTGYEADQVYDGTEAHNIHFWSTYWAPGTSPIATYIQKNATAIRIKRVDGINLSNFEVYGYKRGVSCEDSGAGACWANVSNFLIDSTTEGFHVDDAQELNVSNGTISGSIQAGYNWGLTTGSAVGEHANVSVSNVNVNAMFGAADITSSNGNFSLNFVTKGSSNQADAIQGTNDSLGPIVVNESTANVSVWGQHYTQKHLAERVWGGSTTAVNGVQYPASGAEFLTDYASLTSWSGYNASCSSVISGVVSISMALGCGMGMQSATTIPAGLYNLSASIMPSGVTGAAQFYLRYQLNSGRYVYTYLPSSPIAIEQWPDGQKINITQPILLTEDASLQLVAIPGTGGSVTITNLSLRSIASGTETVGLTSLLYGSASGMDPRNVGEPLRVSGRAIFGNGGSATKLTCYKADGKTLGYATMSGGDISTCN